MVLKGFNKLMISILNWFASYLVPNVFQFFLSLDVGFGAGSLAVIVIFLVVTFLVIRFIRGLV